MSDPTIQRLISEALKLRYSRRQIFRRGAALGLSASAIGLVLAACGGSDAASTGTTGQSGEAQPTSDRGSSSSGGSGGSSGQTVVVWWNKSYYPEEDEALQKVIDEWQAESGNKIELSFFTTEDLPKKILSGVESNQPPDLAFAHLNDWQINPKLAWEGKLEDVSDVINPVKDTFTDAALQSVNLYNKTADKRSYYAIPLEAQTMHLHYWKPMIEDAGLGPIPDDWDGFWEFWKEAQGAVREKQGNNIYAFGFPVSAQATDTYFLLQQFLEAHQVQFMDDDGKLLFDDPSVISQVAEVMDWETSLYKDGFIPQGAINWLDPDNNLNFINKTTIMTPNPSLSIPASQAGEPEVYNELATQPFPKGPDGQPVTYMVSIKSAIIFDKSKNKEAAKEFMAYLIQPERLADYLKASLGRWFPVMPELLKDPFWADTDDPHIKAAYQQFQQNTRPFQTSLNPAYADVLAQNVWGNAIGQIIVGGAKPEQAVQQAAQRMKEIFARWEG